MGPCEPAHRARPRALQRAGAGRAGLHEPLRLGRQRRRRIRRARVHGNRRERGRRAPLRGHRVGPVPPVRSSVPPRGGRHRPRARDDRQLRARHLRLHAVVDHGAVPRGTGRARARAGGRPVGFPARVGRRRLHGRGPALRARHRLRSAPPAARRQRTDAPGREPRRRRDAARDGPGRTPALRGRQRPVPGGAVGRQRAGAEAAGHRRHVRRGLRARGAAAGDRGSPARPGHHLPRHD